MNPTISQSKDPDKNILNSEVGICWRPLLAGYTAGCCGLVVGHPLDSLKVLLQTSNDRAKQTGQVRTSLSLEFPRRTPALRLSRPSAGVVNSMQRRTLLTGDSAAYAVARIYMINSSTTTLPSESILKGKRSIRSLYAGISTPLATVGLVQSLNFALYDSFRRILHSWDTEKNINNAGFPRGENFFREHDSLSNVFCSAFAAGSIMSFVTSPLIILKTKQQLMIWSLKKAIRDTIQQPGGLIRNLYTGYGIHLFCDSVGRSVFFVCYEKFKRSIIKMKTSGTSIEPSSTSTSISVAERMACACMSGMISWGIVYPFDVVRCKIYSHSALSPSQPVPSTFAMAKKIMEKDGGKSLKPFFRGFGVTVARAGPVAAVALPVYDLVLDSLSD